MNTLSRCVAVSVMFAALSAAHAADAAPIVSISCLPSGVVDATGKIGFVIGKDGDIEALDLETGKLLWTSDKATKPLAVVGKKLIAQAPEKNKAVRIVVLDGAQGGKKVLESDVISFPDWVGTAPYDLRSFWPTIFFDKNHLIYKWRATEYSPIFTPGRPTGLKVEKEAQSAVCINLETGKVEVLADSEVPNNSPKLPRVLENEKSEGYRIGPDLMTKPLNMGDGFAVLVLDDRGEKLSLKRWDATGKGLDTVELLKARWTYLFEKRISTDGRYLLVATQPVARRLLSKEVPAVWVFSLETGKEIAKFPNPEMDGPIAVFGERAFRVSYGAWAEPGSLKAYDLKSGKVAWEHAIESRAAATRRFP